MTTNDICNTISQWTEWASKENNRRYDIALLKIWIQFEKFLAELFVIYATGGVSETGYAPNLLISFSDESQLNVFLRSENKTYIDYLSKIEVLSKHIFKDNPFDVVYLDSDNRKVYNDILYMRNYIAHESGESKTKIIRHLFGNNYSKFMEPNDYLQTKEKNSKNTYYTYYTEAIRNMTILLVDKVH